MNRISLTVWILGLIFSCKGEERLTLTSSDFIIALERDTDPAFLVEKFSNGKIELKFRSSEEPVQFDTILTQKQEVKLDSLLQILPIQSLEAKDCFSLKI